MLLVSKRKDYILQFSFEIKTGKKLNISEVVNSQRAFANNFILKDSFSPKTCLAHTFEEVFDWDVDFESQVHPQEHLDILP